jgi:putative ABC transport system permease protein
MDWQQYVRTQLADITGDAARDAEIVEEIAQDLAQRYDEARVSGVSHEEAVALAASQVREHAQLARALRDADRSRPAHPLPPSSAERNLLRDLWIDAHYAVRLLRRTPAFTTAAILTLALGIGVTIAIFNVIDAVLLRPSPHPDITRLVMLWETDRASGTLHEPASLPDWLDFKSQSRSLDRIGALTALDGSLQPDAGDPVRVAALAVTPDVLEIIGARAVRGRILHASDDRPDATRTVLVSEHLWLSAYGGRDLVGQSIRLNDVPRTVVGIVPTDADFGMVQILRAADYGGGFATRDPRTRVDVWIPLQGDPARLPRSTHPILLLGRLAPRVTLPAAHDELSRIAARLEEQYRNDNDKRGVNTQALSDVVFGAVEPSLVVLMTAVALILVMACANVANLLLTRGTRRLREVAVRSALGAETMRLARQFVAENIVLAMASAAVALGLAFLALRALVGLAPGEIPRLAAIGLDARAMLVAFAGAGAIALVFSLLPIAQMRRAQLSAILKSEKRVTGGRDARRVRSILVVSEVALAVVLVTGAGLLIRTFWTLRTTSPGFDAASTLKVELQLPQRRYPIRNTPLPMSPAVERFNGELLHRVSSLPGVQAAAFAANHPLDGGFASSFLVVHREAEAADWPEISIRRVSPQYFSTLRIPLLSGRLLEDRDRSSSPAGVVINQAVKERMFARRSRRARHRNVGHDMAGGWRSRQRALARRGERPADRDLPADRSRAGKRRSADRADVRRSLGVGGDAARRHPGARSRVDGLRCRTARADPDQLAR